MYQTWFIYKQTGIRDAIFSNSNLLAKYFSFEFSKCVKALTFQARVAGINRISTNVRDQDLEHNAVRNKRKPVIYHQG